MGLYEGAFLAYATSYLAASKVAQENYARQMDRARDAFENSQPQVPCSQCGRTKQTYSHQTCDGCGAPK